MVVLIGYGIDFGVYSTLVWNGGSIYIANIIGFVLGATANVLLIRKFVFRDARFRLHHDIGLTLISNGLMLLVGLALLWLLVEVQQVDVYFSKLVANGITFAINYLIRKAFF